MSYKSYSQLMGETRAYITVTLDISEPVEICDFAGLFAGLGGQFDAYLRDKHPDLKGKAQMYVKEVRQGSIVADLIPSIPDLIGLMDDVVIVAAFASLFSKRVRALISGAFVPGAKKSDIKELNETIQAVAHDKDGTMRVESIRYEDGAWKKTLEIQFDTKEARRAVETLAAQKASLDETERVDHARVLMTFERSSKSDINVNQPTGERVVIEEISPNPKALIYASDLAEQIIKHEIRESDDNIYKKGFVVDTNVRSRQGRIVAYAITHVHQVIDLPDD